MKNQGPSVHHKIAVPAKSMGYTPTAGADQGKAGEKRVLGPEEIGQVYFISNGAAIKIGWSGAPKLRLQTLQGSSHQPLTILATFDGTKSDERALHERFAHLRLKGEWFRSEASLLAFIEMLRTDGKGTVVSQALRAQISQVRDELSAWGKNKPDVIRGQCMSLDNILHRLSARPDDTEMLTVAVMAISGIEANKEWWLRMRGRWASSERQ